MRGDMEPEQERGAGIRAVDRVCDILDTLSREPRGISLTQIARECSLAKGSVHRYLTALEARRYVERVNGESTYRLGRALVALQAGHIDDLVWHARPLLEQLRDELGETTNLGIRDGDRVAYLEIVESPLSMRMAARRGDRDYLHCTALGKVLAADLDATRLGALLGDTPLPRRTEHSITDRDELMRELELVRQRGYAVDDCENEVGGRCVAVRIPGPLEAAVSVSAPAARLAQREVANVAAKLRDVATKLAQ